MRMKKWQLQHTSESDGIRISIPVEHIHQREGMVGVTGLDKSRTQIISLGTTEETLQKVQLRTVPGMIRPFSSASVIML